MPETRAYKLNKQRQPAATEGMLLYYFYDRGKLSSCEVTEYQFDRLVELDTEMYNNERRAEAHKATYVKADGRTYYNMAKSQLRVLQQSNSRLLTEGRKDKK